MSSISQRVATRVPAVCPSEACARAAAWAVPLLLAALTLAVFSPVGHCDFVRWDDDVHIYENPYLHPVTLANVAHFWRVPYQGLYVPLSYTVFAALTLAARAPSLPHGLSPQVFHLANLTLHLANVLLVFALLRRVVRQPWAAGAGALLFAVHPIQVEAVAWISELRGLLCAFFCLLALWLYGNYGLALRNALGTPSVSPAPNKTSEPV